MLPAPIATQPHYGDHLGDAEYWGPYVLEVLRRQDLPVAEVEAPFVGSFPTFLVGDLVVKLFGPGFDGGQACAAERSMHELLSSQDDLPVPALLAHGVLFDEPERWQWPFLVSERLRGEAVRDRPLVGPVGRRIAERLGGAIARLHGLRPPAAVVGRDVIADLRAEAASRLARFGLPEHLVEQVPSFLSDAAAPDTLVHADITADHLFHDGESVTGVIDWGDAIVADRWYELVPIAFDCFRSDFELLGVFLDAYGWNVDAEFPRRAMQGVCEFQFDAVSTIGSLVDLDAARSLEEVADSLFAPLLRL